jgi:hypothetical protein
MGHNLLKESELKLYLENDEYYILKRIGTKKSFLKLKNKITDALNQRQTRR